MIHAGLHGHTAYQHKTVNISIKTYLWLGHYAMVCARNHDIPLLCSSIYPMNTCHNWSAVLSRQHAKGTTVTVQASYQTYRGPNVYKIDSTYMAEMMAA
jgi:hypothetical protein